MQLHLVNKVWKASFVLCLNAEVSGKKLKRFGWMGLKGILGLVLIKFIFHVDIANPVELQSVVEMAE